MSATPGPWSAISCRHGWYVESASEPSVVIDTADAEGRYGAIALEADAKLIAAAPDLLEALKNLVERIEYYSSLRGMGPNIEDWEYTEGSGDMAKARAAIAKATQP